MNVRSLIATTIAAPVLLLGGGFGVPASAATVDPNCSGLLCGGNVGGDSNPLPIPENPPGGGQCAAAIESTRIIATVAVADSVGWQALYTAERERAVAAESRADRLQAQVDRLRAKLNKRR